MYGLVLSSFILLFSSSSFAVEAFNLKIMNAEGGETEQFNTADYTDGIYIVEGYFYNCPYCQNNAFRVSELAAKYADVEEVHVLDVGYDCSSRDYSNWINKHNPNHPVLNDCRGSQLLIPLGIRSYPSVRILDCKLDVRYAHTGEWNEQTLGEIHEIIDSLIEEDCSTLPDVEP